MNLRAVLAVLVVGGAVAAVAVLSQPEHGTRTGGDIETGTGNPGNGGGTTNGPTQQGAPGREPFTSSKDCRSCHAEVWVEWESSYHAMAWTDPMVQALADGFRKSECIDCHAPLPIHVTGVGQRVAPRTHDRTAGVDCISCHILEDGVSVAARRTIDTSKTPGACKPVEVPAMADASTCAGCHNQHETVLELETSGIGKTCSDCHMEPVKRWNGAQGRGHTFPGGHSAEMHRRAVNLEAVVKHGAIVATVANVGAGHKIPTDARHRSYNLWISLWDERGNLLVDNRQIDEMRLYYRQDFMESTQVAHGKPRVTTWRIPEGVKGRVRVRLTYALNPEELGKGIVTEVATVEVDVR
jgi:hypothetical protein